MAEVRGRLVVVAVVLVLVAGVAAVVLALTRADDDAAGPAGSLPTVAVTATPSVRPDPATWCSEFRTFTAATDAFVAGPDDDTADAVVRRGLDLLALGQPLGLDDGGLTSLRQLVVSAMGDAGGPTELPSGAPADPVALDGYLRTTCPASS